MKTYCFALDLHEDPELIAEYRRYHHEEVIWPEVVDRIRSEGVLSEEIYMTGNRLFMILCTTDQFSLEAKQASDSQDPRMRAWEELMWKFQKPLPHAVADEKWVLMEKIFEVK